MIEIDKSNQNSTHFKLLYKGPFNNSIGKELEKGVKLHIKKNHRIEIDLNELLIIQPEAYLYLSRIVKQTFDLDCDLIFINVHDEINDIIDSVTFNSEG